MQPQQDQAPANSLPTTAQGQPLLVVISGPAGAGKDAVRDTLRSWGVDAHFAVTATNRPPRKGEVDGRDYHFLSDEEFDRRLHEGRFIEHAIVYGQKKGVPREEVLEPLERGRDVIARVDIQGAATLRELRPDALLIFIAPPSPEAERERLEGRGSETDAELALRLETARREMEAARDFDYVIVNEDGRLEDAARQVLEVIQQEKARRSARD